ncbi:hypothetical protein ASPBRDRAFT_75834 [Aspergillus brasiliensis CBS 101740]|uniref:F-box domain-containing protein n=1 Tax=Aspergillus brasiliensis (strain CBS 101740 / IMI 381727 / IBT 21946) TaxID=767769 RepID=A0A1L9UHP9_ASPBC|nr:hypothetical protein ASPBRDRAFT_75834 [Aspergillus brasiliensis CBS 101740]
MPELDTVSNDSSLLFSSDDDHSDGHYNDSNLDGNYDFQRCGICGYAFYSNRFSSRRYILHNIINDGCQISGVVIPRTNYGTFLVPWKKSDGLIYEPRTDEQRRKTVMPVPITKVDERVHTPISYYEGTISHDWMGYPVHARCWELLMHHKLGDIANKNLKVVMEAIKQRHEKNSWRPVRGIPDEWLEDPVRTKCVQAALEQVTVKRTRDKKKIFHQKCTPRIRESMLLRLPWEVLNMVFNYLPSQAVANVQRALHLRLDHDFWRSRISTQLFHEVATYTRGINWKQLCFKLERRLEKSEALAVRQHLLICLDEILAFCNSY